MVFSRKKSNDKSSDQLAQRRAVRASVDQVVNGDPKIKALELGLSFIQSKDELPAREILDNNDLIQYARRNNTVVLIDGTVVSSTPFTMKNVQHIRSMLHSNNMHAQHVLVEKPIIESLYSDYDAANDDDSKTEEIVEDTQATRNLDLLIKDSHDRNASDIHIQIRINETQIKNRINSSLELVDTTSRAMGLAMANVAFGVMSRKNFVVSKIQQGSFTRDIQGKQHRLRINSQYVEGGSDIVIRELSCTPIGEKRHEDFIPSFEELGFGKLHERLMYEAIQAAKGVVIISGPTGSGKTTTIASALNVVPDHLKTYTIEDPVEKLIPNASQISITADADEKEELTKKIAQAQKNLMRQDPDVILVGEVRDLGAAKTLIDMSTTGHLAFATIHTNNALTILTRLHDMGVTWERLGTPEMLSLLIYQRLVGHLCDHCKLPIDQMHQKHPFGDNASQQYLYAKSRIDRAISEITSSGSSYQVYTRNPCGCKHCKKGYQGRLAALEMIRVDKACCRYIRNGQMLELEDHLKSQGWENIRDHALHLVKHGLIDPYMSDEPVGPFGDDDNLNNFSYKKARDEIIERFSNGDSQ